MGGTAMASRAARPAGLVRLQNFTPRALVINRGVTRYNHGRDNKSLDASGGSVFLNLLGAAEGALIRAAASTQPLSRIAF